MTTFVQGLFFVAGFGAFVIGVMGLIGTALGDVFYDLRDVVRVIGGVLMIVFGFFTLRLVKIPFLYMDTRRGLNRTKPASSLQSFLTGVSFAAGWSPCIGPFLGAILSLSATASGLAQRLILLTAYVAGLGVPFLLMALLADRMTPLLTKLKRNMRVIEIISGVLLILVGVALLSGGLAQWSSQLAGLNNDLETAVLGSGDGNAPSVLIAAAAGFLSFASPCVLPLLPAYLSYIGGWSVNQAASE
jgi:cytochrome c-type biogenesis protein